MCNFCGKSTLVLLERSFLVKDYPIILKYNTLSFIQKHFIGQQIPKDDQSLTLTQRSANANVMLT